MITIEKASSFDALTIHKLVHQIYYPTYKDILSKDQIDFMLEKSYTVNALQNAMSEGQDFYVMAKDDDPLGFMAVTEKSEEILRIEKLYLLPETQGLGLGKKFITFAVEEAKNRKKSLLELNVNRGNKAYFFYLKQGFLVTQEIDIPYYGYILDDYVMQKIVL